jgi:hypothetical protein
MADSFYEIALRFHNESRFAGLYKKLRKMVIVGFRKMEG